MTPASGATPADATLLSSIAIDTPDRVQVPTRHNRDVEWDDFAPIAYWKHNYRYLRPDDTEIIHSVATFFAKHFAAHPGRIARGVDVGSGSNLYPALSMLPWCDAIHLIDHSPANVDWLKTNAALPEAGADGDWDWDWQIFWDEFSLNYEEYRDTLDARARLHRATDGNIYEQSVFHLPTNTFGMGTMFFVAESMTEFQSEFVVATTKFLDSLLPGAPFAAAFMDSSVGYVVDTKFFPAVEKVTQPVVKALLEERKADFTIHKVQVPAEDPLRDGYAGMLIAVGTTAPLRPPPQ